MTSPFPARIHILLAQQAPVGVVIRRGPAKQVATMLWDRSTDQFQLGQWLKGKIYERRCDLSPDGKYFIYFTLKGKWQSESKGSWTAISRAPYLKALVMIPFGDTWGGGGLWTSETSYWLNGNVTPLRDSDLVQRDKTYRPPVFTGSFGLTAYYARLMRDGWQLNLYESRANEPAKSDVFDKFIGHGWILRKFTNASTNSPEGKGFYWDTHQIVRLHPKASFDFPDWEWADYDRHRLVWATGGKLFAGQIAEEGLIDQTELYDFNSMTFEAIVAPY